MLATSAMQLKKVKNLELLIFNCLEPVWPADIWPAQLTNKKRWKNFFYCVADVGMYFVLDILKLLKAKNKIHNKFYLGIGFEEKSTT